MAYAEGDAEDGYDNGQCKDPVIVPCCATMRIIACVIVLTRTIATGTRRMLRIARERVANLSWFMVEQKVNSGTFSEIRAWLSYPSTKFNFALSCLSSFQNLLATGFDFFGGVWYNWDRQEMGR